MSLDTCYLSFRSLGSRATGRPHARNAPPGISQCKMSIAVPRWTNIEGPRLHTLSLSLKRGLAYSPTAYILGSGVPELLPSVKGLGLTIC
jgi:hypothetical protein